MNSKQVWRKEKKGNLKMVYKSQKVEEMLKN
jgi:hypothetical protein